MNNKRNNQSNNSKRKLLKIVSAGGILSASVPQIWSKPIVSSVLLPAHASSTEAEDEPGSGALMVTVGGLVDLSSAVFVENGSASRLLDLFVSQAHALSPTEGRLCAMIEGNVVSSVSFTFTDVVFTGGPGTQGSVIMLTPSIVQSVNLQVIIDNVSSAGATYILRDGGNTLDTGSLGNSCPTTGEGAFNAGC